MPNMIFETHITADGHLHCPAELLQIDPDATIKILVMRRDIEAEKQLDPAATERLALFREWLPKATGSMTSGMTTEEIMNLTRGRD